jgi:hypothetical protein
MLRRGRRLRPVDPFAFSISLIVSGVGVAFAVAAFLNRERLKEQRPIPTLMVMAIVNVLLGIAIWFFYARRT